MNKIKRIFIANRGEIARRIAQTAHRMGIESVVITDQSEPQQYLRSVVTNFVRIPEETTQVYLDGAKMIELAVRSGADAIHPGFGFLSENAQFAQSAIDAGLTWIGPSPKAIHSMASKAKARALAEESGVPMTPGIKGFSVPENENGDFSELEAFAEQAGYPLLLKAAMGGGGKGMRLVRQKSELRQAALRAYSEGLSSFGDGSLICERYVETSRHVEVQIMADKHGNVMAVGDRDCSVQRRHQKILEEAPAFQLGSETRRILHESAIKLARAVGYENAGTVEFLVEWSHQHRGKASQPIYFLEMNTRLQVEHPVTEEVHGVDLVEWQIRIANDEVLSQDFLARKPQGHSIEARLYAEDCRSQFFPSPGKVKCFLPAILPGVRWEIGLDAIDEITPKFDPMVAKVIATADTRENSIALLARALKETLFLGPATNKEYLVQILENTPFKGEAQSTRFIDDHHAAIVQEMDRHHHDRDLALSALSTLEQKNGSLSTLYFHGKPNAELITNWVFSVNRLPLADVHLDWESKLTLTRAPGESLVFGVLNTKGLSFKYACYEGQKEKTFAVFRSGHTWMKTKMRRGLESSSGHASADSGLSAPVPGKVMKILAAPGEHVQKNQTIFILESMKMEFEVKANQDGTLGELRVKESDQVSSGQVLAQWSL